MCLARHQRDRTARASLKNPPKHGKITPSKGEKELMGQLTFAEAEYAVKKRKTRREKFLERMDSLLPWQKLERQLAEVDPKTWTGC